MARRPGRYVPLPDPVQISGSEWPASTQTSAKVVDISSIVPASAVAIQLIIRFQASSAIGAAAHAFLAPASSAFFIGPFSVLQTAAGGNAKEIFGDYTLKLDGVQSFRAFYSRSSTSSLNEGWVVGYYE